MFIKLGFAEKDIDVVPAANGNIQYEANNRNILLEIEVDKEFYQEWEKKNA